MIPEHVQWTISAINEDFHGQLERFRKFVRPERNPNFQLHIKIGDRPFVGTLFLCVDHSELEEFDTLRKEIQVYYVCVLERPDPRYCHLFFDLDDKYEFSAEDLHRILFPEFPDAPICYFGKLETELQTDWHIIVGLPGTWYDHCHRVRALIEQWQEPDDSPDGRIKAHFVRSIDVSVYGRPPSLRLYGCPKIYPRQEMDPLKYQPLEWGSGYELAMKDRGQRFINFRGHSSKAPRFLTPSAPNTVSAEEPFDYWSSQGRLLPAPLHRKLLSFDYSLRETPRGVFKLIEATLLEFGLGRSKQLTWDQFNLLEERIFDYFNRHFAKVHGDVYVRNPSTYVTKNTNRPDKFVWKVMSHDKFKQAHCEIATILTVGDGDPKRYNWPDRWLKSPNSKSFIVARSFSKAPIGNEECFNKWTGNILPHEAFLAAKGNSRVAYKTVDFFCAFLKEVVCNDPYETPEYNQWAFEIIMHLLIWTVKYPHERFPFAVVFWSSEQGIGKGRLTEILGALTGIANVYHSIGMRGLTGDFLGYIGDKQLIIIDEEPSQKALQEAYPVLKHIVTDELLTASEKYRDPETRNTMATVVMTQNDLISVPAADRRIAAFGLNPQRRNDMEYWRKFTDLCGNSDGHHYIAAWLYGIEECPDFKVGVPVVIGNLRVRMAENRTDTNPLARILVPLFGTISHSKSRKLVWRVDGEFVREEWIETDQEVGDSLPFETDVSLQRFVENWFHNQTPSHNYSQTLVRGMAIPRDKLFEACKEISSSAVNVHNLPNFVQELFGRKGRDLLCPVNSQNKYKYCTIPRMGALWEGGPQIDLEWYEPLIERFCNAIWDNLPKVIPPAGIPGVWPVPFKRLMEFINYGVSLDPQPRMNIYEVTYAYGHAVTAPMCAAHMCWPALPELRKLYFATSGGERTPASRIPKYPLPSLDWYQTGFRWLKGHQHPAEVNLWRPDQEPTVTEEERNDYGQWLDWIREEKRAENELQREIAERRALRTRNAVVSEPRDLSHTWT